MKVIVLPVKVAFGVAGALVLSVLVLLWGIYTAQQKNAKDKRDLVEARAQVVKLERLNDAYTKLFKKQGCP